MALPQNLANSSTPGSEVALGTVTKELKTGETTLEVSAKPPTPLEAAGQFTIVVDKEIMLVTAGQKTTSWTVSRAQESSVEAAHLLGAEVWDLLTLAALEKFVGESEKIKAKGIAKEAITEEQQASESSGTRVFVKESITNEKVKKEGLEPNRLEKEKLTSAQIKAEGLTAADLKKEEITSTQIKPEGIKEASYEKLSITAAKIAKETITGEKLANETITEEQLGSESVSEAKILGLNVTESKLSAECVSTAKIQAKAVTPAKMAISWKAPVAVATTESLPASTTVGSTIKGTTKVRLEADKQKAVVGQRWLVKNQAGAADDGIYEVTKQGEAGTEVWEIKRTSDANTTAELQDAVTIVEKGNENEGSRWTQTATVTTVGTTKQVWTGDIGPVTTVAMAYRKAALNVKNATLTIIPVDTVIADPGALIKEGAYVVPSTGYYQVDAQCSIKGAAGQAMNVTIYVEAAARANGQQGTVAAATSVISVASAIVKCVAGEKITARVSQANTAAAEVPLEPLGEAFNFLHVVRVA